MINGISDCSCQDSQMNTILEEQFSDQVLDEYVRVANEAADAAATVIKQFFWEPKLIQTFNKRDDGNCCFFLLLLFFVFCTYIFSFIDQIYVFFPY